LSAYHTIDRAHKRDAFGLALLVQETRADMVKQTSLLRFIHLSTGVQINELDWIEKGFQQEIGRLSRLFRTLDSRSRQF